MAKKPVRALRARQSFAVGGVGRVTRGQLLRSDDPRAKGREELFDDVNETLGIEQATQNPGQKRKAAKPAPEEESAEPAEESAETEEG